MSTQNSASVQKHRAKMAEEGYARMEVTLSRKFIGQAREFARQKQMPLWQLVEQSIIAYATSGNASKGNDTNRSHTDSDNDSKGL